MMPNSTLTSLANALTDLTARRSEIRAQDRQAQRSEGANEAFGSLVSEWAHQTRPANRPGSRVQTQRDTRPEADPAAHAAPRAEDVAPRSRAADARSRPEEAPRARRDEARRPDDEAPAPARRREKGPVGQDDHRADPVDADTKKATRAADDDAGDATSGKPDDHAAEAAATQDEATVTVETAPDSAETMATAPEAPAETPAANNAMPATTAAQAAIAAQAIAPETATTPATATETGIAVAATAVSGKQGPVAQALEQQAAIVETATESTKSAIAKDAPPADHPAVKAESAKAEDTQETKPGTKPEQTKAKGASEQAARPQAHHPIKALPLADLFQGIGAPNAIYKPADILAGLDRGLPNAAGPGQDVRSVRPTPLQMLPIEIGMQAVRGVTSFQIRLDPAELGRVDVKLDIRENGEVNASLVVDRVETLQMLRRDASTLQQAFEQAGLKQSADGLSFSLRGDGQPGQQQEPGREGRPAAGLEDLGPSQMGEIVMRRALVSTSSLDLMI